MDPHTTPIPAHQPPPVPYPAPAAPAAYLPASAALPAAVATGWRPKSKTTAVLLAVFLSFYTWVYTSERDAWKFWMNLGITSLNVFLSAVTVGIWLFVAIPYGLGVWIWSIVDVASKPQEYYDRYPYG